MNGVIPIVLATFLYVWMSFNYFAGQRRIGMTICFIGYSIANIGLIIDFFEVRRLIAQIEGSFVVSKGNK